MNARPPIDIRPLVARDLPALLAIQRACYGAGHEESEAVFARRLASPAQRSLALTQSGLLRAYLAAYVSLRGKVTPLHGDFEAVATPDTLYLHDMAVSPDCAGRGYARLLLQRLQDDVSAGAIGFAALVAVQGSQGFWERQGFRVWELTSAEQRARLAGYGPHAVYMGRALR